MIHVVTIFGEGRADVVAINYAIKQLKLVATGFDISFRVIKLVLQCEKIYVEYLGSIKSEKNA
jgi:hypothetical protein